MSHSKVSNWPGALRYSNRPIYHASVNKEVRHFLQSGPTGAKETDNTPCKVYIRKIADSAHPAHGQCGLFAGKRIPPNAFILDYIGEVHCEDRPESDYDLSLHRFPDGLSVGIDASRVGNEARFTNDYRGVQKKPNAFFTDYRTQSGELRMCIKSRGEIKKGEEILISYGKSWWSNREDE
ncbi:SET domain protein, partial [Coprinellus micaceus]